MHAATGRPRRSFLSVADATALTGLAGCSGTEEDPSGQPTAASTTTAATTTGTTTKTAEPDRELTVDLSLPPEARSFTAVTETARSTRYQLTGTIEDPNGVETLGVGFVNDWIRDGEPITPVEPTAVSGTTLELPGEAFRIAVPATIVAPGPNRVLLSSSESV